MTTTRCSMMCLNHLTSWIDRKRAKNLVRILKPYIHGATLDVGCGNGRVTKLLQHNDIIGIDIVSPPQPQIEIHRFDGVKIPFADKKFRTVLCCAALHHAENQTGLLEEMKRVGGQIVILEDSYDRILEKLSVILLHAIGSRFVRIRYRISGFKTDEAWRRFFADHGLVVKLASDHPGVQPFWLMLRHHLYVLEQAPTGARE